MKNFGGKLNQVIITAIIILLLVQFHLVEMKTVSDNEITTTGDSSEEDLLTSVSKETAENVLKSSRILRTLQQIVVTPVSPENTVLLSDETSKIQSPPNIIMDTTVSVTTNSNSGDSTPSDTTSSKSRSTNHKIVKFLVASSSTTAPSVSSFPFFKSAIVVGGETHRIQSASTPIYSSVKKYSSTPLPYKYSVLSDTAINKKTYLLPVETKVLSKDAAIKEAKFTSHPPVDDEDYKGNSINKISGDGEIEDPVHRHPDTSDLPENTAKQFDYPTNNTAEDQYYLFNNSKQPITVEHNLCENGKYPSATVSFGWVDYVILAGTLIISCAFGLYNGLLGSEQPSGYEFFVAGGTMDTFVMGVSLSSSFVTAIEILGSPAEMYNYGLQLWMICMTVILVVPLVCRLYLPVFMYLKTTSIYEYLSTRFDKKTRYLASVLFIIQMLFLTSVTVLVPSLAISYVTGLKKYIAITAVFFVGVLFTAQGGMRTIMFMDCFKMSIIFAFLVVIAIVGTEVVGINIIWSENYNTKRLDIFNNDVSNRHSFWAVVIGGSFYWLTMFGSNQVAIQKYMSVLTIFDTRRGLWIAAIVLIILNTLLFYIGMIMVGEYRNCDPMQAGLIISFDQILPTYILSTMADIVGSPGLFCSGLFIASLGSVATAMNSLSAITINDFLIEAFHIDVQESKAARWASVISVLYGIICFLLVLAIEQIEHMTAIVIVISAIIGGIIFGLFTLGMFFPWATGKGALCGALIGLVSVSWIGIGNLMALENGSLKYDRKATNTDDCQCYNRTTIEETPHSNESVFIFYQISQLWYSLIGSVITITVGIVTSFILGPNYPQNINPNLLSPPVKNFFNFFIIRAPTTDIQMRELPSPVPRSVQRRNISRHASRQELCDIPEEDENEIETSQ